MTDDSPRSPSRRRMLQLAAGTAAVAGCWRLVECLRELSVAQRSTSVPFPDFTRGGWSEARA